MAVEIKLCEAAGILLEFKGELPVPKLTVYVAEQAAEPSPVLECE